LLHGDPHIVVVNTPWYLEVGEVHDLRAKALTPAGVPGHQKMKNA